MVKFENGNLLDAPVDYICHQVNCQGRMGSGIAKQIKERWPVVYEKYTAAYKQREDEVFRGHYGNTLNVTETLLGHVQNIPVSDNLTVINMFSQQYYGYDGKKYTSYDAFWDCLQGIVLTVPKGSRIGFPAKILRFLKYEAIINITKTPNNHCNKNTNIIGTQVILV